LFTSTDWVTKRHECITINVNDRWGKGGRMSKSNWKWNIAWIYLMDLPKFDEQGLIKIILKKYYFNIFSNKKIVWTVNVIKLFLEG